MLVDTNLPRHQRPYRRRNPFRCDSSITPAIEGQVSVKGLTRGFAEIDVGVTAWLGDHDQAPAILRSAAPSLAW